MVGELCGDKVAAGDQRHAPDERHLGHAAALATPGAEHHLIEVELPVRVCLGHVAGEVGACLEGVGPTSSPASTNET